MTEWGIFNDEGLLEGQFYSLTEANLAVLDRCADEPTPVPVSPCVRGLLNGHDCAVAFEDDEVMCFYAHELAVAS